MVLLRKGLLQAIIDMGRLVGMANLMTAVEKSFVGFR